VRALTENIRKLVKHLNFEDNKGYVISVGLALIFVSVLVGYYLTSRPGPQEYTTIYLLDSQGKAANYPELLVIGQNNTFKVEVGVENHMEKSQNFEVREKVANDTTVTIPVNVEPAVTYSSTLENGKMWVKTATVSLDKTGNYLVDFELWKYDQTTGAFQFSGNFCVLNVKVIS